MPQSPYIYEIKSNIKNSKIYQLSNNGSIGKCTIGYRSSTHNALEGPGLQIRRGSKSVHLKLLD